MPSDVALVITSISSPNAALIDYARQAAVHGCRFILIGDSKSPADFVLDGCDFWSLLRQQTMPFSLAKLVPERHYARKNLGYLQAIFEGATIIIETDDDNFARPEFWEERKAAQSVAVLENADWVNIYGYFTDSRIWPRGFPLEQLHAELPPAGPVLDDVNCPIQQGLADENPDVDAVYRLTYPLPQNFRVNLSLALGPGSWCPFNSQNTTWFREAFPLLYLPAYCSFRMTDIWRSFVAQRICWENGWHVQFHRPTVWQERNQHNLLKDFTDEIPGYLNNAAICAALQKLKLKPGKKLLGDNLLRCYQVMIDMGLVGEQEQNLLRAWIADISPLLT